MFIGVCWLYNMWNKIFRVQILYTFIINSLKKIIYPKGVFILKYDQNPIDNKFVSSIISFIYMYLIIFFISCFTFTNRSGFFNFYFWGCNLYI